MTALLNAPIVYDYAEERCGPVNDRGTQNGFILKLPLHSETPL